MFRKLFFIMLCLLLLLCVGCGDREDPVAPAATGRTESTTEVQEQPLETEPTSETTQPTEETTEAEPSETEEATEPPTEEIFAPIDPDEPVVEAYTASVTEGTAAVTYTCSLPQIQCESSYAQTVNQELSELYYEGLDEESIWHGGNKSFDWYVNGDILSLIIYHYNTEKPSDYEVNLRHSIYNLRMSDGSKVSDGEILEISGVSEEDFRTRAQQILGNTYLLMGLSDIVWEGHISDPEIRAIDYNYTQFVATVSQENLDLIEVFLGEDGALCFMGRKYLVAGGFEYSTPLFDYFAEFEVSPYYEAMIALVP